MLFLHDFPRILPLGSLCKKCSVAWRKDMMFGRPWKFFEQFKSQTRALGDRLGVWLHHFRPHSSSSKKIRVYPKKCVPILTTERLSAGFQRAILQDWNPQKSGEILKNRLPIDVCARQNLLRRRMITPNTLLDSLWHAYHFTNLSRGQTMRQTHGNGNFVWNLIFKNQPKW